MSYYEQSAKPSISGLGAVGIQQAAAGYEGRRPRIPKQGPMWGFGDLIYTDGTVYWRVKDASETLSSIAVKVYGSVTVQKDIWNANPQGRAQSSAKFGDQKWGWYNVGTLLKLPKVPGYPDPYEAAKKAGLVVAQEGETVVLSDGSVATIGSGGQIAKAGMGLYVGLAAAAVGVCAVVYYAKKKKGGSSSSAMVKA